MGISGCTPCQVGGVEALKAYDAALQLKRNEEKAHEARASEARPDRTADVQENRPTANAVLGGTINVKV